MGSYDGSNFVPIEHYNKLADAAREVVEHHEMNEIVEHAPAAGVIVRLKEALDG